MPNPATSALTSFGRQYTANDPITEQSVPPNMLVAPPHPVYGMSDAARQIVQKRIGLSGSTSRLQRRQMAKMRMQLEQAAAHPGLPEFTVDDARHAMEAEDSTWADRFFGFESRGSTLQSIIDVLSLGNYASAALAQSAINSEAGQDYFEKGTTSAYSMGFSTAEFMRSWRERDTYKDVFRYDELDDMTIGQLFKSGKFYKALAADIFLDPLTYMTFGIGPLTKVAFTQGAKAALFKTLGREAAEQFVKKAQYTTSGRVARAAIGEAAGKFGKRAVETVEGAEKLDLHLTRYGSVIYEIAARRLRGGLAEKATARNKAIAEGLEEGPQLMHGSVEQLVDFHNQIMETMIRDYDSLALEASTAKVWSQNPLRTMVGRARSIGGKSVDAAKEVTSGIWNQPSRIRPLEAMFRETAPILEKEIGFYTTGAFGRVLQKATNKVPVANSFFKVFNQTWGLDGPTRSVYEAYRNNLAYNTVNSQRRITKLFEKYTEEERSAAARYIEDGSTDLEARNAATSLASISFARPSQRVQDCAAQARQIFDEIAEEEKKWGLLGESINDYVTHFYKTSKALNEYHSLMRKSEMRSVKNPFAMHQAIATLQRASEVFGEKNVVTDLGEIVWRRQKMSHEYIAQRKFHTQIQSMHGLPAAIRENSRIGMDRHIKDWLIANRDKADVIVHVDQSFASPELNIGQYGFKQGSHKRNREVISFMTGAGRDQTQSYVTPALRLASDIPRKINEIDVNAFLDHLYEGAPLPGKHSKSEIVSFAKKLDKAMRENGVPLHAVLPDFADRIAKKTGARARKGVTLKGLRDALNAPIEGVKLAAQLPEDMLLRAKTMRMHIGDFTDNLKPNAKVLNEVDDLAKRMGFMPEELEQVTENLFGIKNLDKLSARQADSLVDYLHGFTGQTGARMVSGKRPKTVWDAFIQGEPLVRFTFQPWLKQRKTTVSEVLDKVHQAMDDAASNVAKKDKRLASERSSLKGLREKRKELQAKYGTKKGVREYLHETNDELRVAHEAIPDQKVFKKADNEWRKAREFIKQISKAWDVRIEKGIKETSKYSKEVKFLRAEKAKEIKRLRGVRDDLKKAKKRAWRDRVAAVQKYNSEYEKALTESADDIKKTFNDELYQSELGIFSSKKRIEHAQKAAKEARKLAKGEALRRRYAIAQQRAIRKPTKKNKRAVEKLRAQLDTKTAAEDTVDLVPPEPITEGLARTPENIDDAIPQEHLGPQITKGMEPFSVQADTWYLPASIAQLLEETGKFRGEQNRILRGWDFIQNLFKAPLMAPHIAFFKRNAVTNAALISLRCGLSLLHPKRQKDFLRVFAYYLANEGSDLAKSGRLIKSGAKAGALVGATGGSIAGIGTAIHDDDVSFLEGMLGGAVLGMGSGAAFVGTTAAAMTGGIQIARSLSTREIVKPVMDALAEATEPVSESLASKISSLGEKSIKIGNKDYTVAEVIDEAEKRGVFWTHTSHEVFKSGMAAHKAQMIGMTDMFRGGELLTESPTRLMLFMNVAQETGSFRQAGIAVKDYLFDFSSLSNFERKVIRRGIPFYSWVKHALNVSYNSIIEYPGRVSAQFKFLDNSDDYDPLEMPDWLQNKLKRIRRDSDGSLVIKANIGLAHEDAVDLGESVLSAVKYAYAAAGGKSDQEAYRDAMRLMSRTAFGVSSAMELLFNRETFSGKAIMYGEDFESGFSPKQYEKSAEWLQKAVGYKVNPVTGEPQIAPGWAWLMGEIPHSRFLNMAKQVYEVDEFDHKSINYASLARKLLAESVYRYDPDQQTYYANRKKISAMTMALKNLGLMRSMSLTYGLKKKGIPKREMRVLAPS